MNASSSVFGTGSAAERPIACPSASTQKRKRSGRRIGIGRANSKYTDRARLHPNLARFPPMPYRHRDSMSRKLRAMRDARERRRLEFGANLARFGCNLARSVYLE